MRYLLGDRVIWNRMRVKWRCQLLKKGVSYNEISIEREGDMEEYERKDGDIRD